MKQKDDLETKRRKRREYQRKWRKRNPEKAKEHTRRTREKNRQKYNEKCKKIRDKLGQERTEYMRQYMRDYYKTEKGRQNIKAASKRWYQRKRKGENNDGQQQNQVDDSE